MGDAAQPGERVPPILGIAGGIGAGKSHVAAAFARRGWLVFDFDQLTREALGAASVAQTLAQWWGPGVVTAAGEVNRQAVGRIVFADAVQRRRLEELIHPMVWRTRAQAIAAVRSARAPGVVFDAPLLFEAGLDAECDAVVFVEADQATREARVNASRGWSAEELGRRELAQMALEEKRRRCRFSVDNSGQGPDLDGQVAEVIAMIFSSDGRGDPSSADM
ncbi:MAG: dephospho-CoA kinase [Phycisphaerales bacterium]|nr:dephospho-CoA kinase [Phycisphaerales bacterium]